MNYQELFEGESEYLIERMNLARERIAEIVQTPSVPAAYADYFVTVAGFICKIYDVFDEKLSGEWDKKSAEELAEQNHELYADILADNYSTSFANPDYAVSCLGDTFGGILSFLYTDIRGMIVYCFEGSFELMTIFSELFLEVYAHFELDSEPQLSDVAGSIYSFYHDYSEIFSENSVRNTVDPTLSFAKDIIMESDLSDTSYLYSFGEYISDTELSVAQFLNTLPESDIYDMAYTYTEGYRKGFELAGIDLSTKKTVNIRYNLGFERMIRAAIEQFAQMGLEPTIYRNSVCSFSGGTNSRAGYGSVAANKQYDYDHSSDQAYYLDKAFAMRRLETLKVAYEKHKSQAREFAGPAVVEVFGEIPFSPVTKQTRKDYDEKQREIRVSYMASAGQITNEYIHGDERSFTIIAYPIPSIGDDFEAIFKRTVEVNTLDYKKYQTIQQHLIDALDQGSYVRVKGSGNNRTDMTVKLYKLSDPDSETIFENCVADVNIPVGEVFTSPVLEGTCGTLHVSKVYLNELEYRDLWVTFEDGMITDYGCSNFDSIDENRKYIEENVLFHHATLPIGEFAIGTNTTAYAMAKEYNIADKLPILIAEKTGPHFAVGDTCYSHQEDMATYNPDGKRIVARDNSVSILRKTDISKAYMNCHTDITLPFEELAYIEVVRTDGSTIDLIRDGKFVLPGTEELNEPLQ